jgi:hypothetical protein
VDKKIIEGIVAQLMNPPGKRHVETQRHSGPTQNEY